MNHRKTYFALLLLIIAFGIFTFSNKAQANTQSCLQTQWSCDSSANAGQTGQQCGYYKGSGSDTTQTCTCPGSQIATCNNPYPAALTDRLPGSAWGCRDENVDATNLGYMRQCGSFGGCGVCVTPPPLGGSCTDPSDACNLQTSCCGTAAVNGSCGSSGGASLFSAPTSGLCYEGSASAVSGSGPWSWTCTGFGSGHSNASCGASSSGLTIRANPTTKTVNLGSYYTIDVFVAGTNQLYDGADLSVTGNPSQLNPGPAYQYQNGVTGGAPYQSGLWNATYFPSSCWAGYLGSCKFTFGGTSGPPGKYTLTFKTSERGDPNTGYYFNPANQAQTSVTLIVLPIISGSCSATHYSCTKGTSSGNAESSPNWIWTCNGSGGGTNASCSQPIPPPTNLVASCPSPGTTASISWALPVGYTQSYFRSTDTTTGTNPSTYIPENVTDTGPFTSPTTISGHSYHALVYTRLSSGAFSNAIASDFTCSAMSGTLTPTNASCAVALGASSCTVNLSWSISNPVKTPTAITASGMTNVNVTSTLTTPQSGSQSLSVPWGGRIFYLYNNAVLLAQNTVPASSVTCAPGGTGWDGTKCAVGAPVINSFVASKYSDISGFNSTLSWTTTGATSCAISGGWNGSSLSANSSQLISNIISSASYTLTCVNSVGTPVSAPPINLTVTLPKFSIVVVPSIGGSVKSTVPNNAINCGSTCSAPYAQGTVVTLVATPNSATWKFAGWSGGGCSGLGNCNVTADSNKTVNAMFVPKPSDYREF